MINSSQKYPVLSPKAYHTDGEKASETGVWVQLSIVHYSLPTRVLRYLRLKLLLCSPGQQQKQINNQSRLA